MSVKAKGQAFGLEQMMLTKEQSSTYDIALALRKVKASSVAQLRTGDVLFFGKKPLSLVLVQDEMKIADLELFNDGIKIIHKNVNPVKKIHTKKYETLMASFSKVFLTEFSEGMTVSTERLDFGCLTLSVEGKAWARGSLQKVEDEIAIKITELIDG